MDKNTNTSPEKTATTAQKTAAVYPEPGKQRLASREAKILSITPFHIPWLNIALLGLGATIIAILAFLFLTNRNYLTASNLDSFTNGAYLTFILIGTCLGGLMYWLLNKWGLRHPAAIAWTTVGFGFAIYLILVKKGAVILGLDAIALIPGSIVALPVGPALLMGITLATNRFPQTHITVGVLTVLAVGALIVGVQLDTTKSVVTTVRQTAWAITPQYLPKGVRERGGETCARQIVHDDAYACLYYFDAYPGYLTQDSQTKINQALSVSSHRAVSPYEQPMPFFQVTVARDDKLLKPYQLTNGTCDIQNMEEVANTTITYRASDAYTHKPRPRFCIRAATPNGTDIYYDSPKNNLSSDVQVPTSYYFKRGGNIVMIQVGDGSIPQINTTAHYLTDPSFRSELYKFFDSFN